MTALDAIADEQLMRLVRTPQGRGACDVLIRRHKDHAVRFALKLTGNMDDALDASQEAFVKIFTKADRFDDERAFLPWFLTIVRNSVRSMQRTPWRKRRSAHGEDLLQHVSSDADNPAAAARAAELWAMVLELSPKLREVLVLRHMEGLSYEEIAQVLDVPMNTVATRLHAARKKLAERYEV